MSRTAALTYGAALETSATRLSENIPQHSGSILTCCQDFVADEEEGSVGKLLKLIHYGGECS